MKRISTLLILFLAVHGVLMAGVGFGVQGGIFSPSRGLDDNDNGLAIGLHLQFKLAFLGVKFEGFYVDSSGRYEDELGSEFGAADLDVRSILAGDVMFYPAGALFFLQAGVNRIDIDQSGLDLDTLDNDLGLEVGAGFTFFDKLMIQGKIMYTPDAFKDEAVDTLRSLDSTNLTGYLVTVGWNF